MDFLRDLELCGVKWELNDNNSQDAAANDSSVVGAHNCAPLVAERPIILSRVPRDGAQICAPTTIPSRAPVNVDNAVQSAQQVANNCADFESLCEAIENFDHLLKVFARKTVLPHFKFHTSHSTPHTLLILTDSPSSEDEISGEILSGAAGELFEKMLGAIGMARGDVAICPLVFWHTPGGRTATDEELAIAQPFVDRFIELSNPKIILTLGSLAKNRLTPYSSRLTCFSIQHPNYLLLKPDAKKQAWEELQKLKAEN